MNQSQQFVNITTSTLFRFILIILGIFFLYLIKDILLMVIIAIIIAAAATGPVNWLQNRRVPRLLGVVFIYLFFLLLLALVIALVIPPLGEQIKQLANVFPDFLDQISVGFQKLWGEYRLESNLQTILNKLGDKLSQATSNIFSTIIDLFGGLLSVIIILVISFYLTVQEKGIKRFFISLTPSEHQHYLSDLIDRIVIKIGGWLRGQLLIMLVIAILTFIGLKFLGIKYALILALIAGILEIIPYIGPILAAIPAVILAFIQSPLLALLVIALYVVVQQLENYVIYPQVMKKTVGLNPIIIIIVMLIGAKLAGILGIILAVPLTASIAEILKDFKG